MRFKVSRRDKFRKTAIIAEVNEKLSKKFGLASDYWDIIPYDKQTESFDTSDESLKSNMRVLSHAQVVFQVNLTRVQIFDNFSPLFVLPPFNSILYATIVLLKCKLGWIITYLII